MEIPNKIELSKFRPMRNLLLIQMYERGMESVNGIFMPVTADPDYSRAKVIKAGPGSRTMTGELIPPGVKEGEDILIPGNIEKSLRKIKLDGEDYLLIEEASVLAAV